MPGVSGRELIAAFAQTNTWRQPATVTRQILFTSTEGLDDMPQVVEDESFNQEYLGPGEIGDRNPITQEIAMQARFEQMDSFFAGACGSAATPTVVSSQAANSLVAYQHVITLAPELGDFFTAALLMGKDPTQYILEIPSFKVRGFSLRVGEQGRITVAFPIVGNRATYDSTVNISSSLYSARVAEVGNRLFRRYCRVRLNAQSAIALATADEVNDLKDWEWDYERPLAQDNVANADTIYEPDDDGALTATLRFNFARMNTRSANSMALAFAVGNLFKCDMLYVGPYINSTTQRSMLFEMPALQVEEYAAPGQGHSQIRPSVLFKMRLASAAPSGMSGLVNPFRITLTNTNSAVLVT